MRKSVIILGGLFLIVSPLQANISGSGAIGGGIATGEQVQGPHYKEVNTKLDAEMERLNAKIRSLKEENRKLRMEKNRTRTKKKKPRKKKRSRW